MTEDDAQRSWHLKQLRQSLHGLAHAASNQPALFPDSVASADDLAFGTTTGATWCVAPTAAT